MNATVFFIQVKGGHGDWRRKILGDLTVMNPSEVTRFVFIFLIMFLLAFIALIYFVKNIHRCQDG